jgi:hypothetical protein
VHRTALATAPFLFGTIINAAFLRAGGCRLIPIKMPLFGLLRTPSVSLIYFLWGAVRTVDGVA